MADVMTAMTAMTDLGAPAPSTGRWPDLEVRYLDLDGDGVPDAVETISITRSPFGDGRQIVEVVERTQSGIDIAGKPSRTEMTDVLRVEEVAGPPRVDHGGGVSAS
jgi:hypothetical protein